MHREAAIIVTLVSIATIVRGYGNGPPVNNHPELCDDMFPSGHGANESTSDPYYEIIVSDSCYKEGSTLKARLRIEDASDEMQYFEGFFILARKTDGTETSYGTFDHMDQEYMQILNCHGATNNAIGHSDHKHYMARTFRWTAPDSDMGPLHFVATVVRGKEEIWLGITSDTISYDTNCNATGYLADEEYDDYDADAPCSASHEGCGAAAIGLHTALFIVAIATAVVLHAKRH